MITNEKNSWSLRSTPDKSPNRSGLLIRSRSPGDRVKPHRQRGVYLYTALYRRARRARRDFPTRNFEPGNQPLIDNREYFVLNDFYEADLNSYQQGAVHFQLPSLSAGFHSLKIKAWDVLDNSSEYILEFNVVKDEELVLSHVLNYPNPFTTKTQFWFEHNRPGQNLQVKVQIFTVSGKVVKTIKQTINDAGNRSFEVEWNGRDEYGDKLARGVYLYRLTVITPDGRKKEKVERLVIL
jgi:hypothetical protein